MTNTDLQIKRINSLTAHDLFLMDTDRRTNLMDIRITMTHPFITGSAEQAEDILRDEQEDFDEYIERQEWF